MTVLAWLSVLVSWSVVSTASLVLSMLFLAPQKIGPMGVTLWFVVFFLSLASIVCLAFYTAKTFLHLHANGASRLRYARRQGLLVSAWCTGLLCLSSLRNLSVLDAILLALLLVIVEVYVRFRWP